MSLTPEHLAPRDSLLARRDARWRVAAFGLAVVGVAVLQGVWAALAAILFAIVVAYLGRVPGRWYRARIGVLLVTLSPFLVCVPFTVDRGDRLWEWSVLHVTDAGLIVAMTLAMRTVAIVTLVLTGFAAAPLHVTLSAAGRLGVPSLLVHLTLLTYRYVFLLLDELHRLRVALRVRGFRNAMTAHSYRTIGQVTGTLVVRGSERAERVAHAMRCRGFDGRFRTLYSFRTTPADVAMLIAIVAPVAGLVAWDVCG